MISTLYSFSQENKDQIIFELKELTANSGFFYINKTDSTKTTVYQLCNHWSDKVNQLRKNLDSTDIENLINDQNAAINVLGYIFKLEKNNIKENAIDILNEMMSSKIKFMKSSCSDANSTYSHYRYLLMLMTNENPYFKADFEFKKKELEKLKNRMMAIEFVVHYKLN